MTQKLAPRHPLPKSQVVDREEFLLELCHQKRVLHIGCANWPFTENLLSSGALAHLSLAESCKELAGIDSSEDGIAALQEHGIKDVFACDATDPLSLAATLAKLTWTPDLFLASEVLEHIDSPGHFLRSCVSNMASDNTLVITVPNALRIRGILHIALGHEKVHSDHVAYYSWATLSQLLSRYGLRSTRTLLYRSPSDNLVERALDIALTPILKLRPFWADGLIMECHLTV